MVRPKRLCILHGSVFAALLLASACLFAGPLIVVGENSRLTVLSRGQVSDVFLGKITVLPDGRRVIPVDQPGNSPLRDEFYSEMTNKTAAQASAYWAKLYFTGRGIPPREGAGNGDVKKILNSTPGAIGYIDQSALDNSVRVVRIVE